MIAQFDTNSTSYWLGGNPKFKFSLARVVGDLKRKRATLAISTVTLQELLVFSRQSGSMDRDHQWITERFNILPFDEPCALAAARLSAVVGSPNGPERRRERGRPASRLEKDVWQRDAAIVGTAEHHGVAYLVTADSGMYHNYRHHMSNCQILLLEESPEPIADASQSASTQEQPPQAQVALPDSGQPGQPVD